jgi:hypothetical protein
MKAKYIIIVIISFLGLFGHSIRSNADVMLEKEDSIHKIIMDRVKQINTQCPIKADEATTYLQTLMSGKTLIIKAQIKDEYLDKIDYGKFKRKMCKNYSKLLDKQFVEFIKTEGYSVQYLFFDEHDIAITKIKISGEDILKYY